MNKKLKRSAVCCILVGDEVLLLERTYKDETIAGWCLPGGKQDKGEDDLTTALRELTEETGIKVTNATYVTDCISGTHQYMVAIFYKKMSKKPKVTISNEHLAYAWVRVSKLDKLNLAGNTKQFINEIINVLS